MNYTLKGALAKSSQETYLSWPDLLPLALLHAHCTPGRLRLSLFELVYSRPLPCLGSFRADLHQIGDKTIVEQLQALGTTLRDLRKDTLERTLIPLGDPVHPFQAGDSV
jgi:hypothetical protein